MQSLYTLESRDDDSVPLVYVCSMEFNRFATERMQWMQNLWHGTNVILLLKCIQSIDGRNSPKIDIALNLCNNKKMRVISINTFNKYKSRIELYNAD